MALDIRGFNVPETPYRLSEVPNELYQRKLQQQRYDYMLQKDQEADEWKKLNLIQDLTDLSKHQTSSDVANAIGNTVAGNVLQKYTQLAKNMSPTELQANVQREMGGIINGMEAAKNELDNSDEQIKLLKQAHPEIDISSLARDMRADILNRRITHDSFVNPLEVQDSQLNLDDPNVLSRYVTNTKGLDEEIQNPKGLDPSTVASGDPYTNVEYSAKIPFWMQANYDESKMKNGFLPKGFIPRLSIKSEELPTDFLPALKGQQRKIVAHDVWQHFDAKYLLQLIAGTRAMFPNYDQMSDGEKELAQRDYLYGKISSLDKSQFSYKSSKTPSASMIKIWQGDNSNKPVNSDFVNMYPNIVSKVEQNKRTRWDALTGDEQNVIKSYMNSEDANNVNGDNTALTKDGNGNVLVFRTKKDENGNITFGHLITTLSKEGVNTKASTPLGTKAKNAAHQDAKSNNKPKGEFDDL